MYVYSAYPSILKFFMIVEAFTSLSLTNMKNVNCSSPNYFYIFKNVILFSSAIGPYSSVIGSLPNIRSMIFNAFAIV